MCNHEYDMKADGVTRQMTSCGAYVCFLCDDHEGLARCFCGWAADGGDGVAQLIGWGENMDEDWDYDAAFASDDGGWDY